MIFFMLVGAVDRLLGNRFGYGKKFEEGIMAIGTLSLAMLGIISLSPLIASALKPIITPLYKLIGADPAMFAGTILANDMGGYSLKRLDFLEDYSLMLLWELLFLLLFQ